MGIEEEKSQTLFHALVCHEKQMLLFKYVIFLQVLLFFFCFFFLLCITIIFSWEDILYLFFSDVEILATCLNMVNYRQPRQCMIRLFIYFESAGRGTDDSYVNLDVYQKIGNIRSICEQSVRFQNDRKFMNVLFQEISHVADGI